MSSARPGFAAVLALVVSALAPSACRHAPATGAAPPELIRLAPADDATYDHQVTLDGAAEPVRIYWTGHLDADATEDVILEYPRWVGSWGHRWLGVYAGRPDGSYANLWGPDYAYTLTVGDEPAPDGWRELVLHERPDEPGEPGPRTLRFTDGRYDWAPWP